MNSLHALLLIGALCALINTVRRNSLLWPWQVDAFFCAVGIVWLAVI